MCLVLPPLLASCTPAGSSEQASADEAQLVTVFYGTNRDRRDPDQPTRFYGEKRGELEWGRSVVSTVPGGDNSQLILVEPTSRKRFLTELESAVASAPEPTVLLFVHGFLRSFRQVSQLVAQFSADTGFRGVPVMWSWPSTTNPTRYTVDETNVKWAEPDFAEFLADVLEQSGARAVHLVGHSLGGRSLSRVVLGRLVPAGHDLSGVGEFVLLAPDIDRDIFERELGPGLLAAGLRLTLYTSANDKAMAGALAIHGNRRAGDSAGGPIVLPGMETIDVTEENRSILGHSYFEESAQVTQDLASLISERLPADRRDHLVPVVAGDRRYWRLMVGE